MAVQLGGCIYTNTSWKEPELIILQSLFFPGVSPSFNEVIPICFHHAVICWTNFVHLYQMSSGFVPCKLQDVKGVPESSFKCSKNGTSPSLLLKLTIPRKLLRRFVDVSFHQKFHVPIFNLHTPPQERKF